MNSFKQFFADIGNWIFNNVIRLEGSTKTIVALICFALVFWCIRCYIVGVGKKVKGPDGVERHSSQSTIAFICGILLVLYIILLLIY